MRMRPDIYNHQFESETTGKRIRRQLTLSNILLVVTSVIIIATGSLVYTSHTNNENTIQLQQQPTVVTTSTYLKGYMATSNNVPSSIPTQIPHTVSEEEYDDDNDENFETFLRKSKYPTRHPRKKTAVPSSAINTLLSSIIVTEDTSSSPTPMIILANDDFHVTPIVVINSEVDTEYANNNTMFSSIAASTVSVQPYSYSHANGNNHAY